MIARESLAIVDHNTNVGRKQVSCKYKYYFQCNRTVFCRLSPRLGSPGSGQSVTELGLSGMWERWRLPRTTSSGMILPEKSYRFWYSYNICYYIFYMFSVLRLALCQILSCLQVQTSPKISLRLKNPAKKTCCRNTKQGWNIEICDFLLKPM